MKPKILIVSNMYPSDKYPAYGIFVKNFIDNLSLNFDFTNVLIKGRQLSKLKKFITYIIFFLQVIYHAVFKKNDYLYVHYISQVSVVLFFIYPFIRTKVILNFHGSDMIGKFSTFKKIMFYFTKKISHKVDLIVVPSEFFKSKAIEVLGVDQNKVYVYPSGGINIELFYKKDKDTCRNLFGLKHDDFVIGMVSSIYIAKGWKVFLDAVSLLNDEIQNFKVLVAGYGIEEKEFLEYVKIKSLEDTVVYVGEKSHTELTEIYNSLDVFVFPTMLEESLGLVGLEAMACGIPVVGSNIGGLTDYIKNDYNGFLFNVCDSRDLALKIKMCVKNKKLSKGAISTALEFSSIKVALELINKLKDLKC